MTRRERNLRIAIIALVVNLGGLFAAIARGQDLVLQWPIAYSGNDARGVGWDLENGGWPRFIATKVRPALAWAKASNVDVAILLLNPWGQDGDPQRIDGYDQARAIGARHLTNDFATAKGWKQITKDVRCYGYVGGVDLTPSLRSRSTGERAEIICRNLKPFADAGFRGVYVDAAENAIYVPFAGVNERQSTARSVDVLTMAIADDMFVESCGIEATPRAFTMFRHLWPRDCVLQESTYQHRYGPNRHANWKALGYDRSVLTGKVWRTLDYSDDVAAVVARAKAIAADGDVPCVCPAPLISAGVKASELVGAK